ncbi:DUF3169 family protein [Paenibacillus sp. J5C2022]|uniref:DUF3169 family protein n=1 Tax=Paenibacillus sp. J5C2022 TaxID=2977129 RepID=UPI0021D15774|nr:DUF3169 family protein [Paenibacillus sp. J5C2022]
MVIIGDRLENLFDRNTVFFYFANMILLLIPAGILFVRGKKPYIELIKSNEEEIDPSVQNKARYLDLSMTLSGIFVVLNFMLFGTLYHKTSEQSSTVLVLFMLGILLASVLQVTTMKFVQSVDRRLKGDPTKLTFNKEFVESLDEAEQLRAYKAGYRAFQTTKSATLAIVVLSILLNIIFNTGGLLVFTSCIFMLVQTLSFSYHERQRIPN